jgi:bla regulator protein blaR1
VTRRRSAKHLYRLHLALAGIGLALVLSAGGSVIAAADQNLPSAASIAQACDRWLSTGGPMAVAGLAVALLALATLLNGMRSVRRQVAATRRYLDSLPVSDREIASAGARCRLIEVTQPQAFCAGYLRPRIYLSRGTVQVLGNDELRAIVAHELHHLRRRDPLRLLLARALADALFFIPLLRRISERYADLGELAADEAAVGDLESERPLASALLKFAERTTGPAPVVAVAAERVDHLLGDPEAGRWRLPRSLVGQNTLILVGLGAILMSVWHGLLAPTLELPLLLAAGCMTVMVGGPIALAVYAVTLSRRMMRARRA